MTSDMQNSSPSHSAENAESSARGAQGSGLPMRGLAMILIAVAVLLAAWAVWSMTTDSDDSASGGTDTTQTQNATSPDTPDSPAAPGERATVGAEVTASGAQDGATDATPADANPGDTPPAGETPAADAPRQPAREADAGTPVTTLHVLNNSTVPQLAARVADSLERDYDNVESGNLPDIAIPQNTVYFTGGNPEAEKAARELADRVSGIAMERSDVLPAETDGDDAIVLVLVEDVTL